MQLSAAQTRLAMGLIVALVAGLAYFLWTKSAPPAPAPGPGQTIQNPFGPQTSKAAEVPNQAASPTGAQAGASGPGTGPAGSAPMGSLPPGMTVPRGTPATGAPFSDGQFRRMNTHKTGP